MFSNSIFLLVVVAIIFLVCLAVSRWMKRGQSNAGASNIGANAGVSNIGWGGLDPGDLMEYKGKRYLYRGINKEGGPGMAGIPEPEFMPPDPGSLLRYYLRPIGSIFSRKIFGEENKPIRFRNVLVGFLNDVVPTEIKKVGHITPEQWRAMAAGGEKK